MYFCALKILVVSTSKESAEIIAKSFGKPEAPEDSEYEVNTAVFGEPLEIGLDTAVVIDRDISELSKYKKQNGERIVFITLAAHLAELNVELLSKIDDFWVMPDGKDNNGKLLKVYFAKLLNELKEISDDRKQEICFRTVIDSLPDLVWFKDNDGAHLIVNYEFCGVVEKTKKQIYKRHHNYIWDVPEDDYENGEGVCKQSEDVVIRERKTCQFEEKITTRDGMRQLVTYKSPLIDADGQIFGTCGMGHDITDLQNVSKELRFIIDSIPFGVALMDKDDTIVTINRFLHQFFPGAEESIGHNFTEWIDGLEKEKLTTATDEHAEVEYRIELNGREHILRLYGEPILDIFGETIGFIKFIRDVTMQYKFEQQNIKHANTDFLTGLNNRRSLFDYLTKQDMNSKIAIIMLDLDKFKSVNDTYGHAAGDEALLITSRTLEEIFGYGFIARLGGDEFLIALVGEYELSDVEHYTQRLLDTLIKNFKTKEEFHALSASAGIAQDRLDVCDMKNIENLIKRSDDALYNAKESGRAQYCVNR